MRRLWRRHRHTFTDRLGAHRFGDRSYCDGCGAEFVFTELGGGIHPGFEPVGAVKARQEKRRVAGAKQERERIEARIKELRMLAPSWPDDDSYEAGLDSALASITEEGKGDE